LSFERFLRILLKFDLIGYMPYLRQILTSKPQKSSQNTSPLFYFGGSSRECFSKISQNFRSAGYMTWLLTEIVNLKGYEI